VRHVRMLGLCLVAAFAVAAFAASSALAGPQWGKCEYVGSGGNYTGPNCDKNAGEKAKPKGSGDYEWRNGEEVGNVAFEGNGGEGVLTFIPRVCEGEAEGIELGSERTRECEEGGVYEFEEEQVTCEVEHATGEQEGKNKVAHVVVTFKGCVTFGVIPCYNINYNEETEEPGEIQTNELQGKLGWINKNTSPKQVGVVLNPVNKKAKRFATFECANGLVGVGVGQGKFTTEGCAYQENVKKCGGDGVISPIVPINEMTPTFTQEYTQNSEDENIPTSLEGKPRQSLESYLENQEGEPPGSSLWSRAGEVINNVNSVCEVGFTNCEEHPGEGEIKA
jgi:hypothetical protein